MKLFLLIASLTLFTGAIISILDDWNKEFIFGFAIMFVLMFLTTIASFVEDSKNKYS